MIKIVMVRHGQTDYNLNRLVQGRIDNPLNENGRKQAYLLAEHLKQAHKTFDAILSSPLSRALQTASILRQSLGYQEPIDIIQHFVERDFNQLDGISVDEAMPLVRTKNYAHPGYETDEMMIQRISKAAFNLLNKYDGQSLLCVAHSHVIKSLLIYSNPQKFTFSNYFLTNGDMMYFEIHPKEIKFIKHVKHPEGSLK